jgi:hypothetical protein
VDRWATAPAGWVAQAVRVGGGWLGRVGNSAQFEFKSNLNFNDFYSHSKIQEHFITPRKICNSMNATNNYLFKYITL